MTAQNNLEQHGNFFDHPFAEILLEVTQAKFNGSLRVSSGDRKSIIYFRSGSIVYAVSNSKSLRLFNILLRTGRIDTKVISRHPNFANDVEFSASLIGSNVLTKKEVADTFSEQMSHIVVDVLSWAEGEWTFSPLVRARGDLSYSVDVYRILIDHARRASSDQILRHLWDAEESFAKHKEERPALDLQAHEAFVLSSFDERPLTIEELCGICPMPEGGIRQALYVLWLGGLLVRRDWNSAFPANKVGEILSAKVSKVKDAAAPVVEASPGKTETVSERESVKLPETTLTLEQYLDQIEKAETHYDSLGVAVDADTDAVKTAYFSLAKMFHPDRHHRQSEGMLRRIQSAFTVIAHAHETLKSTDSREAYNSKMYKEIEAREKRRAAGQSEAPDVNDRRVEQSLENFEEALKLIGEKEYEAAAGHLSRAVHYSPQNALYRAYFGLALSKTDEKHRHKAEAELQAAVKLDQKNAKIRLMLVDFLLEMKMAKRAEGELKRFLDLVPNDKDVLAALARTKH